MLLAALLVARPADAWISRSQSRYGVTIDHINNESIGRGVGRALSMPLLLSWLLALFVRYVAKRCGAKNRKPEPVNQVDPFPAPIAPRPAQLMGPPAAMLKGWGVYSAKIGEGDDYNMDHTATTFLIDETGELAGTLAYGENPDTALAKLERLVGV